MAEKSSYWDLEKNSPITPTYCATDMHQGRWDKPRFLILLTYSTAFEQYTEPLWVWELLSQVPAILVMQTTGPCGRLSVLIADSTRMGSQLLADALRRDKRFVTLQQCSAADEVLSASGAQAFDVALISSTLDGNPLKGMEICEQVQRVQQPPATVILLDTSSPDLVVNAFACGARGVFCRTQSIDLLCKCLYSIYLGQIWASSEELRYVLKALSTSCPHRLFDSGGAALLSRREQEIIRHVSEGLSNREIAERLNLSAHTVKNYVCRIFGKLGVSTRAEMVLYAFSQQQQAFRTTDYVADVAPLHQKAPKPCY